MRNCRSEVILPKTRSFFGFFAPFVVLCSFFVLAGCESLEDGNGGKKGVSAKAKLAGEWIVPNNSNVYLVFKPDSTDDSFGRLLGLDEYDSYRVRNVNPFAHDLHLELTSRDAPMDSKASAVVSFSKDFQSITFSLDPGNGLGQGAPKVYHRSPD